MATTYWITFRIADRKVDGKSYEERYATLQETIRQSSSRWWTESTSFIVFDSDSNITDLARYCESAISRAHDLLLIRTMDSKSALIIGLVGDEDIFKMMPYLKYA